MSTLSRLLRSLVGVPIILSNPGVATGVGLVMLERGAGTAEEEDGPDCELEDQYPTPGFRDRSINCTEDWTLRISSRNVRFVWRSCVDRVFDSSSWAFKLVISVWRFAISSRADRYMSA